MARYRDVAAYIVRALGGGVTHMKLQKLMYYAQAWSLVWDSKPLFRARIEAWINGPVVRSLYNDLRFYYDVRLKDLTNVGGKPDALTNDQRETVDAVLKYYGDKPPHWLSALTHQEDPWVNARKGLDPRDRGKEEISLLSMEEYYSGEYGTLFAD